MTENLTSLELINALNNLRPGEDCSNPYCRAHCAAATEAASLLLQQGGDENLSSLEIGNITTQMDELGECEQSFVVTQMISTILATARGEFN